MGFVQLACRLFCQQVFWSCEELETRLWRRLESGLGRTLAHHGPWLVSTHTRGICRVLNTLAHKQTNDGAYIWYTEWEGQGTHAEVWSLERDRWVPEEQFSKPYRRSLSFIPSPCQSLEWVLRATERKDLKLFVDHLKQNIFLLYKVVPALSLNSNT